MIGLDQIFADTRKVYFIPERLDPNNVKIFWPATNCLDMIKIAKLKVQLYCFLTVLLYNPCERCLLHLKEIFLLRYLLQAVFT